MTDVDTLASVAAQLAARVRDDDPEAVGRWLQAVAPSYDDRWALLFILAAAVPMDQPFSHLTAWVRVDAEVIEHRRKVLDDALRPHRKASAA